MINRDIIKLLRKHQGEVVARIAGRDDYHDVKVVKSDLIAMLSKQPDADIGFQFELVNETGYFDRDYSVEPWYDAGKHG